MISNERLKALLAEENLTCVLSDGNRLIKSRERGVKPLIGFIESGKSFKGFTAADKVVGKAAALLYADGLPVYQGGQSCGYGFREAERIPHAVGSCKAAEEMSGGNNDHYIPGQRNT